MPEAPGTRPLPGALCPLRLPMRGCTHRSPTGFLAPAPANPGELVMVGVGRCDAAPAPAVFQWSKRKRGAGGAGSPSCLSCTQTPYPGCSGLGRSGVGPDTVRPEEKPAGTLTLGAPKSGWGRGAQPCRQAASCQLSSFAAAAQFRQEGKHLLIIDLIGSEKKCAHRPRGGCE